MLLLRLLLLFVVVLLLLPGADSAIGAGEQAVLVLPCEVGALEAQRAGEHALYVVGDLDGGLAAGAGELLG